MLESAEYVGLAERVGWLWHVRSVRQTCHVRAAGWVGQAREVRAAGSVGHAREAREAGQA
ncbi:MULTISPECIES: hypothetical protein [unclassified Streptomyces]|uniref:hypothetical protein n=1 Tax=unclassified Streptomyces TaxID=2593676 RepID=UPI002DDB9235|nr:hypothetical protein [Streptomyces sp. NBC_00243]WRZ20837.1 hypothetical protein OHT59_21175 [Streptomyces sp. NBC_00243]